ncbi:MAG: hypothetical protein AAFQ80_15090 [Cyanobacteria bacterium J06621_8]
MKLNLTITIDANGVLNSYRYQQGIKPDELPPMETVIKKEIGKILHGTINVESLNIVPETCITTVISNHDIRNVLLNIQGQNWNILDSEALIVLNYIRDNFNPEEGALWEIIYNAIMHLQDQEIIDLINSPSSQTFEDWKRQLDSKLIEIVGTGTECMDDQCYLDWFNDGVGIKEAVERLADEEGFNELLNGVNYE